MAAGQSIVYEEFSVTPFMRGYLAVMETIKPVKKNIMEKHLKEIMVVAEVYGSGPVRAYHAIWLQQIENRHAQCSDTNAKLEFRQECSPSGCSTQGGWHWEEKQT